MRKALNENPRVQLAVLGIGGLLLAFMLMTSLSGGDDAEPEPAAEPTGSSSSTAPPATGATPAESAPAAPSTPAPVEATPVTPPATTAPPATGDAGSAEGLLPTEGLPEDVLVAYARNKAIALLVIDPKGISDKTVKRYTKALRSEGNVEVFVVKAGKIANYARITQGVSVSRTPSLVVIRPRGKTDAVPVATVSEGFRDGKSVRIALKDALYTDGQVPSYPE
jgi:hypothetical protein